MKKSRKEKKLRTNKFQEEMMSEAKKRMRRSPLHSKIESEFKKNHVIPTLEMRKQTLAEIRNFHQPIRLSHIRVHSSMLPST